MRTACAIVLVVLLSATVPGSAQESPDYPMLEKIRAEGLDHSKVLETFDHLTTVIGPRLTNSAAHKRSIAWVQDILKSYGLSDVHAEPWQFGRGWTMDRVSVEMIEPRYMPLIGYPKGWSPSTAGKIDGCASLVAGPRGGRTQGAGRQAQGRHPHDEPAPGVRDSGGPRGRVRRSQGSTTCAGAAAPAQRREADRAQDRRRGGDCSNPTSANTAPCS